MLIRAAAFGLFALSLAACGDQAEPEPAGEKTGAMMPDTTVPPTNEYVSPDAAATGAVPADGSQPAVRSAEPAAPGGAETAEQPVPPS